jgi:hypothetical protein
VHRILSSHADRMRERSFRLWLCSALRARARELEGAVRRAERLEEAGRLHMTHLETETRRLTAANRELDTALAGARVEANAAAVLAVENKRLNEAVRAADETSRGLQAARGRWEDERRDASAAADRKRADEDAVSRKRLDVWRHTLSHGTALLPVDSLAARPLLCRPPCRTSGVRSHSDSTSCAVSATQQSRSPHSCSGHWQPSARRRPHWPRVPKPTLQRTCI